jgi:HD-like signal output (HDOD) protein
MLTQETTLIESIIQSDQVPTLPEVAVEVLRIAQQAEPCMDELTRVIRMDAAIAGRIVKFANSPLFGIRQTAATIESAVVLLGSTMIRTIVLGFTLAEQGPSDASLRPYFQQIWRETLFQASTAELLGERHTGIDSAVWFLAGLLQDAGRLVMLNVFQQEYVEHVLQSDSDAPLSKREAQVFGFSHAEVSASLCRSWNLGDDLFRAVTTHHAAHTQTSDSPVTIDDVLRTAAICNHYMESVADQGRPTRKAVERELMNVHGCRPDEVVENLAEMDCRARGLAAVLKADVGSMPSRETMLEQAQAILFKIALAEQVRRFSDEPQAPAQFDQSNECTWLDADSGVLSADLFERILPDEISDTAEQEKTLGLLTVELQKPEDVSDRDALHAAADAIRYCVRPDDQIVRHGTFGFVVVLKELSMNMLAKVARRVTEQATETLGESGCRVGVDGLMVIPAGRKIATVKSVLAGLESSRVQTQKTGREQFHILQGKKLRLVQVAE